MSTRPMPLGPFQSASAQGDYQVRAPSEIRALLRRLADEEVPLTLVTPDGLSYTTCLWAGDAERRVLVLSASAADARVQHLVEAEETVAVGYLDNVKVQFDLHGLMLVHGRDASALHARFPTVVFRFQRREGYRVRPPGHACPELQLRLNDEAGTELALRVLDLSHGGVALFLPEGSAALVPGTQLPAARLILEPTTHVQVSVRVVRTDRLDEPVQGQRVGCEIEGLSGVAARTLQRYIDQTQMRQRLLSV